MLFYFRQAAAGGGARDAEPTQSGANCANTGTEEHYTRMSPATIQRGRLPLPGITRRGRASLSIHLDPQDFEPPHLAPKDTQEGDNHGHMVEPRFVQVPRHMQLQQITTRSTRVTLRAHACANPHAQCSLFRCGSTTCTKLNLRGHSALRQGKSSHATPEPKP